MGPQNFPIKGLMKVGVFDSGIGGMTIARAIKEGVPTASVIFFADTAWFPYNDKEESEIQDRFLRASGFFEEQGCSVVVIACNTASVLAYELASERFSGRLNLFSIVDLTIEALLGFPSIQKAVGIIGTVHTVRSGAFQKKINELAPSLLVRALPTPKLAPFSEQYFLTTDKSKLDLNVLYDYLRSEELADIDTLLLACTHYPILMQEIEKFYYGRVQIIDAVEQSKATMKNLSLGKRDFVHDGATTPIVYASKLSESFVKAARYFLGENVTTKEVKI